MPLTNILDDDRYNLDQLTATERLWIWRHRQLATNGRIFGRSGAAMSQEEAASAVGVSPAAYSDLERGAPRAAVEVALAEPTEVVVPTRGELCTVARRRSGELLIDVYEAMGVSRPWYLRLERTGDPRVVTFWEDRGFIFP